MTQPCGSPRLHINGRIIEDEVIPEEQSPRDAWMGYALDLERLTMQERLIREADYVAPKDGQDGIVYIQCGGGRVLYVGQTVNLPWRQVAHERNGRVWDALWLLQMPSDYPWIARGTWLDSVEYGLIAYLKPPHNSRRIMARHSEYILQHLNETRFSVPELWS